MVTHWTPRERALRAALEKVNNELCVTSPLAISRGVAQAFSIINAALADQPPPDPRDEALRMAEAELLRLWKLVPAGRAGVGGVRTIELEDDDVARLRQIVDAIRAAKGGA